jgi:DNA polymerase-3 subunit delta
VVEVRRQELEDLFRNRLGEFDLFLVCGPDTGLVSERCNRIAKRLSELDGVPRGITKFEGDDFAIDEGALIDEAQALSLFGERRLVWIRSGSKNFNKSISALLDSEKIQNQVIIEAGALKADTALRKLCSRSQRAIVIECWPDGPKEISEVIDEGFVRANIKLSSAGKSLLMSALGGDRLLSRTEIEKLILYCHGMESIDAAQVAEIVSDASSWSFDDVVFSAFLGERSAISTKVHAALIHVDATALLTMALIHCLSLLDARNEIEKGTDVNKAAERFPRLFGSRRTSIIDQLRHWSTSHLLAQLQRLQDAVASIRKDPRLQNEFVVRTYLSIAYSAPRKA